MIKQNVFSLKDKVLTIVWNGIMLLHNNANIEQYITEVEDYRIVITRRGAYENNQD